MQHRLRLEAGAEPFPGVQLLQIRGRGGFAEVWEARIDEQRTVALKFIVSQNSSTVKELKSIQSIQRLTHTNLVPIERVWSVPGYIIVQMELADGSLLDLLDVYQQEYSSNIPATELVRYVKQAASGLDFLNTRQHNYESRTVGFQHCDIKPSNLLLFGNTLKLGDFGITAPTTGSLTPFQRCGTLDFCAPEIHRGMLSERSDQYSLAVSYYYLRTGYFPFPPPPTSFTRQYSYARPHPDLSRVPPNEARVLERALEVQPERRWENCTQFATNLQTAVLCNDESPSSASIRVVSNRESA